MAVELTQRLVGEHSLDVEVAFPALVLVEAGVPLPVRGGVLGGGGIPCAWPRREWGKKFTCGK